MTLAHALAAALVAVLGAALQGAVGFGLALVSAPLLLCIDARLVPGPLLVGALLLTLLVAHRERAAMDLRGVRWALIGRVPGTVAGAAALTAIPAGSLPLALAALVLLGVALTASGLRMEPTPRTLVGAGALSGFMGTTSSIGGPPIAMVYQHAPGPRLRGTLAGYFVAGAGMSLTALAVVGRFGAGELRLSLSLLPGIALGFALSGRFARWLDGGYTRIAVLAVSGAAATAVLLRQLL